MQVRLEQHDRIVLDYFSVEGAIEPGKRHHVLVIRSDDVDVYHVLWNSRGIAPDQLHEEFQLIWKGDWEGCLREFRDIVGDLEAEDCIAMNRPRETKVSA